MVRSASISTMEMRRTFLACAVLLVMINLTVAQFIGQQQSPFPSLEQRNQLSPQQQGHILSDIQQHHRFNVLPNGQQQQQFNPQFATNTAFNHQQHQQQHSQPTLYSGQQQFPQQQFIQQFQQSLPRPVLQQSSIVQPTNQPIQTQISGQSQSNQAESAVPANQQRVHQHHTQTSFTPSFDSNRGQASSSESVRNPLQPRPTIDPIQAIQQQIQQLDPDKQKQRIKELREKQAIIEKHNQFVEKQYEKALKKAQQEHEEFVERQQEEKKKLYQKVVKTNGAGNYVSYSQSIPRYIYPEEAELFKQAVEKYYEEHPTTTTTTTTTTTPKPPPSSTTAAPKKVLVSQRQASFLPTALPAPSSSPTASSREFKTIQTLEDLNHLQKQYKSQQINKDDLLAQLRLAIAGEGISPSSSPDEEATAKNLSSREISLANGKRVQLIETADPKLIANGTPEEITLPNGQKVQVIRADNPNLLGGSLKPDEVTLSDGRKIQVVKTSDPKLVASASTDSAVKTQEITLPNGEKVEIIRTTDPKLVPGATPLEPGSELEKLVLSRTTTTTTSKPPKAFFEELTKSVIPSGANYELLKTGASGGLEQIGGLPQNLPNQKKVTFVLLEEQEDGTLKVQGIKGSGKDKPEVDVDSILRKIKDGRIKLPNLKASTTIPPTTTTTTTTPRPFFTSSIRTTQKTLPGVSVVPNSFASSGEDSGIPILKTNIGTNFVATSTPSSTLYTKIFPSSSTMQQFRTTTAPPRISSTTPKRISNRQPHILTHSANDLVRQASTATSSAKQNSIFGPNTYQTAQKKQHSPAPPPPTVTVFQSVTPRVSTTPEYAQEAAAVPDEEEDRSGGFSTGQPTFELTEVLKRSGLFAMARFLRQSGLDTILNETGPYTLFVPTDKAFRTLLVQLGGPEKAEEKFKENPRLLSGLLLHHVIPGSFTIETLQDEMTGVSLAGTQLRVNQYNMHDVEWNDVKITTINGAKVLDEKKDIEIPQGVAHSVDRVMFPLPVGDIVQTLQSDRERRFTNFLRALFASGLAETLQGTKTFTLFAPTDKAFANFSSEDLSRTVSDRVLAKELVLRHLTSGTLYTNGMRYYQIRDSLLADTQLTLNKQSGKVKVNNIPLATQNIPATNGVIHAVDTLL